MTDALNELRATLGLDGISLDPHSPITGQGLDSLGTLQLFDVVSSYVDRQLDDHEIASTPLGELLG